MSEFGVFLIDALGTVRDLVDVCGPVIQGYEFNEHGTSPVAMVDPKGLRELPRRLAKKRALE